ncbi:MAG: RluA family pseudouridine synthase [Terriglobia bacterium]
MAPSHLDPPSELLTFSPPIEERSRRLDHYLCDQLPEKSRSQIQKWIEDGFVRVDGHTPKQSYKVRGGETITVTIPRPSPIAGYAEKIPLDVIYEDADLAVIDKPAGMVVHVGAGVRQGTLVNALLGRFSELSGGSGVSRPGIVHRLDKQTSGLIVVAKNDESHFNLAQQFQSRTVKKAYLALVHGLFNKPQGEIKNAIGRDARHRTRMSIRSKRGREAHTDYEVIEQIGKFSLLRLKIRTGRTHQIRVHLASIKHPVVGDTLYGAPARIVLAQAKQTLPALNRNFLHACALEFSHPRSGEWLAFHCELPGELSQFLDRMRRFYAS